MNPTQRGYIQSESKEFEGIKTCTLNTRIETIKRNLEGGYND